MKSVGSGREYSQQERAGEQRVGDMRWPAVVGEDLKMCQW